MLGHASLTKEELRHSKLSSARATICAQRSWSSSCVLRLLPSAVPPSVWRAGEATVAAAAAARRPLQPLTANSTINHIAVAASLLQAARHLAPLIPALSQAHGQASRVAAAAAAG